MVKINGEEQNLEGCTISAVLSEAGYQPGRVAVERNGEIIPKRLYDETVLVDGDSVEIVGFVGGG